MFGAHVVTALARRGIPVRAGERDPARAAVRRDGAEAVRLDLRDPRTFAAAVAGCGGLFLLRPPAIADVGDHAHLWRR